MADPKPSVLFPAILIAVVLVAAGVGVGLLYEYNHLKTPAAPYTVAIGSNVTVNYIGALGSSPEAGRVFDTSIYTVAINNQSYPKSLEFAYRGSEANYTPLGVSVGPNVPASGYTIDNITFGSVVTGFWQGLIGLQVGQTKTISFPYSLGYGPMNSACFATQPLTFTVPVLLSVTPSNFASSYPNVNVSAGIHFVDPTYGWTDMILTSNASAVVIENQPTVGWAVPGVSWPQVVTALNSTTITVTNQLTSANAGLFAGHVSGSGVCGETTFIVSAVSPANGTYTQNFNREVVGQTLNFTVTIVKSY
jgi:FKBP-type peptidyl-prolyl cis-trans isomerase 2